MSKTVEKHDYKAQWHGIKNKTPEERQKYNKKWSRPVAILEHALQKHS